MGTKFVESGSYEDFVRAYERGPQSSISIHSPSSRLWRELYNQGCEHVVGFYARHPNTRIAMLDASTYPLARTILYTYPNGRVEYSDVYAISPAVRNEFERELIRRKYRPAGMCSEWQVHEHFTMPMYHVGHGDKELWITMMPFFDTHRPVRVAPLSEKEAEIRPMSAKNGVMWSGYSHEGFCIIKEDNILVKEVS